jgi:ABC-type uncharacterized transport system permease subunit
MRHTQRAAIIALDRLPREIRPGSFDVLVLRPTQHAALKP